MKANVTLDREATIALLKNLDIDIQKLIKIEYEKIISREVKDFCDKLLQKQLGKYIREKTIDKIIKETVEKLQNKTESEFSKAVNDVNAEIREYTIIAKDKARKYIRDYEVPNGMNETFIVDAIKKEVKEYLDKKFLK